ncbi:MAG: hypothetical protein ACKVVP_01600 [Chloroflexota bacterium]
MPIELVSEFDLVIHFATTQALGIIIPPPLLAQPRRSSAEKADLLRCSERRVWSVSHR